MVQILDAVNVPFYDEYDAECTEILQQTFNRIKYCRLDEHGPKMGEIGPGSPLIETYFTRLPQNETTARFKKEELVLVNNGWVWGGNALIDNAGAAVAGVSAARSHHLGRLRQAALRQWPVDSPWLWDHMTKYARMLAKYFAGFRIDNAHSTPIHLAEHILDEARRVRPDLYVVAELFSGSEEMGLLLREAARPELAGPRGHAGMEHGRDEPACPQAWWSSNR